MNKCFVSAAMTAVLSASTLAQTTNVACENDYYIAIGGLRFPAVGTPCNPASSRLVPVGVPISLVVETGYAPGSLVVPFVALGPCVPNSLCLPTIACGIPLAGAPCFSNQTGDLASPWAGPVGFTQAGVCQSRLGTPFAYPTILIGSGITFSTQAAILPLGASCAVPSGFVVTEAFNFRF